MSRLSSNVFSSIFSRDDVVGRLTMIFSSSIILDLKYNIVAVHESVLKNLQYESHELVGKNIGTLISNQACLLRLKALLSRGTFQGSLIGFKDSMDAPITFNVSGFHLGLISSINHLQILQVAPTEGPSLSETSLDNFVYHSAHDLRGPLATIKGLISLLQATPLTEESEEIVRLLRFQTEKMDQRLFELHYVSGLSMDSPSPSYDINFTDLETKLREVTVKNAFLDSIEFKFSAPGKISGRCNEHLLATLIVHIQEFILEFSVTTLRPCIEFQFRETPTSLLLSVTFCGFAIDDSLKGVIGDDRFFYSDLVAYPRLVNYYAACKAATELNATLLVQFGTPNSINLEIPFLESGH